MKNNGYGGYRGGGCEHIDKIELGEDAICVHFELIGEEKARNILTGQPEREENYNWLRKHRGENK